MRLNRYERFKGKIKRILSGENEEEVDRGRNKGDGGNEEQREYRFVCSETVSIIRSPNGKAYSKLTTKIHSTHPNSIVITVSAIIKAQEEEKK